MERGGKLDGRALGWGAKEWHVRAESEVGERICEDFWRRLLQLRRMSVFKNKVKGRVFEALEDEVFGLWRA
ncbi:hypothetical protein ME9_00027 [Bartonella taylorii 8TBB]|uniref:Uncharacterized protein n=1 Tax=Bartonella taylorii 8TBB TaxID=1094560 RepID=A0A9P2S107_BARTA|nr:hypothetical protein ME9_00027 [Bartonella taylorii 8TBB]